MNDTTTQTLFIVFLLHDYFGANIVVDSLEIYSPNGKYNHTVPLVGVHYRSCCVVQS